MGKPFKTELLRLESTIEWGRTVDVSELTHFFSHSRARPLFIIGSGGSFTAVEMTRLLMEERGGYAVTHTPLSFLQSHSDLRNANVLIFTAGGNNTDILAAYRAAAQREANSICIMCGSPRSKIQLQAKNNLRTIFFAYKFPAGRDGYLATNSLAAFICLVIRGTGHELPPLSTLSDILHKSDEEWHAIFGAHVCPFFIAIYGDWARPAAIDLESKFSEAGLGAVMPADYRSFAHGRHNWIDKRGADSAVITFRTPESLALADKTLALLPSDTRIVNLTTEVPGPAGGLELLLRIYKFTAYVGEQRQIDPGRPGVPAYGSRLYHLGPAGILTNGGKKQFDVSVDRKLVARHSLANIEDRTRTLNACREYSERLQSEEFGALVLDFDGTVAEHGIADGCLCEEIVTAFSRVLRHQIPIYMATGRGDSIHKILEQSFPQDLWSYIHISYYNGALTLPLSQSSEFVNGLPRNSTLDEINDVIARDPLLTSTAQIKSKHSSQITVKMNAGTCPHSVFNVVRDLVARHAGNKLRVVQSSHSIDIIPTDRTKLDCVAIAQVQLAHKRQVLAIGDRGFSPGNDFDLLTHTYSLSVDEVSTDLNSCWNLLPAGTRNVAGLLLYTGWLKSKKSSFTVRIPKGAFL